MWLRVVTFMPRREIGPTTGKAQEPDPNASGAFDLTETLSSFHTRLGKGLYPGHDTEG